MEMSNETTKECPYCGEVFEGENAITEEGIHRAEEHVNDNDTGSSSSKGQNIVDEWKSEGKRA